MSATVLQAYPWIGERLDDVVEEHGGMYCSAKCPLCNHRHARLRFWVGCDGNLLFCCWAGCAKLEILRAVGAGWRDCFPGGEMPAVVKQQIVKTYDYRDETGQLLYQTVRLEPGTRGRDKDFRQRRKVDGKWVWSLGEVRRVLYRLPELLVADRQETVFAVAGEKDVESLRSIGLVATTNVCGERAEWLESYSQTLSGRYVCVIEDGDSAGRRHTNEVCGSLLNYAASVRRTRLPAKDTTAFLTEQRIRGVTGKADLRDAFLSAVYEAPAWVRECA